MIRRQFRRIPVTDPWRDQPTPCDAADDRAASSFARNAWRRLRSTWLTPTRAILVGIGVIALYVVGHSVPWTRLNTHWRYEELIKHASMEPVELTLWTPEITTFGLNHGTNTGTREHGYRPGEQRITYRMPAAYVSFIDRTEYDGRINKPPRQPPGETLFPGHARIGFRVWSSDFAPVRPDLLADEEVCRRNPPTHGYCDSSLLKGGRVEARFQANDFMVRFELSNIAQTMASRVGSLESHFGIIGYGHEDCEFREYPKLGMLIGRGRPTRAQRNRCRISTSWGFTNDGQPYGSATFLKRDADGSPRFAVFCQLFPGLDNQNEPGNCEMLAYFGMWPVRVRIPSDRARKWDRFHDDLQQFLAAHVVSRTNNEQE